MSLHNDWHVQIARKPAATCVEGERLSTPRGASAVKNLVNLVHHELALRLVSSTLPAVGIALFRFSYNQPPNLVHVCCRCIAQPLSVAFATLLVRVLPVRFSWHSMSRPPRPSMVLQRRFTRALVFAELLVHPRADPPVFFFQTLPHVLRAVHWLLLQPLSPSARCAWVFPPALRRRGSPATAWTVRSTAVATVWASMRHVAISLAVHSVRGPTRGCDRASWSVQPQRIRLNRP